MIKRLTESEISEKMKMLKAWKREGQVISRLYTFTGFIPAMAFVNHVADLAEMMDHHPDIDIRYNRVTLALSTHSAGGLTELDFSLAQKIDA